VGKWEVLADRHGLTLTLIAPLGADYYCGLCSHPALTPKKHKEPCSFYQI
jgi:hypothetical protein